MDYARAFDRLVITGVQTEFCVLSTMMDGVDRGMDMVFVPDACAGETKFLEDAVREIVERMPVQVACRTTDQLLEER